MLYEILRNFIGTVMKLNYRDYIDKVSNKSESIHTNYKIFSASIHAGCSFTGVKILKG